MFVSAIIVAGGKGLRMGSDLPKQFLDLKGKPIISRTIEVFLKSKKINEVIVVMNKQYIEYFNSNILNKFAEYKNIFVVEGGDDRQKSVYKGLEALSAGSDIVLIHDAVRPFVTKDNIETVIQSVEVNDASALGVKIKDTIKLCNENNVIVNHVDREKLWYIQTPQGFKVKLIKEAYEKAIKDSFTTTDDSGIIEYIGGNVNIIEGNNYNIKITTKDDIMLAEAIYKLFNSDIR